MIDSSQPLQQKRSLNFIHKKREAERIDQENAQIMKRLQQQTVSPCLDTKVIRKQMQEISRYKKTIQGTSHRHIDISHIIAKNNMRKAQLSQKSRVISHSNGRKKLPPLPENYFGSQIDEVSSARDSIIENESAMNNYKEILKRRQQQASLHKLSQPKQPSLSKESSKESIKTAGEANLQPK